jgi:CBS domain containing-hemolysin-like protein
MIRRILLQVLTDKHTEDFFSRQAAEAEAEVAICQNGVTKANLAALSVVDPAARQVYQHYLEETGWPALAEIETFNHCRKAILNRAFSVFDDFGLRLR